MPILQSLLLADHVYRDQATGKHIICGVFSTIFFTPNPPPAPVSEGKNETLTSGEGATTRLDSAVAGNAPAGQPSTTRPTNEEIGTRPPATKNQPVQNLMQAGSPYVYFSVTELTGRKSFDLRYVDLRDNHVLFNAEVPIECDDPLKTIEVALPLPRLPLTAWEERVYALEILCEGQLLGSHRVLARINPPQNPPAA